MTRKPIYVTQPSLPPLEEFISYLEQIWETKVLTNGGPFHRQLEAALCDYLDVPYISLFSNGTVALIAALKALEIKGEVITTPYSFVATAHSILWNGLTPVFVDIDPVTLNLDPTKIEAAITSHTSAIMPVHVYGQPCDVDAIDAIAKRHHLKVIYDAAHAFGVRCHCGSVLNHGDLSVLSFHATKVFNTFEGGAIISPDAKTKERIDQLKNFGFIDEVTIAAAGINGKMSELNAAFGIVQLQYVNSALARRKEVAQAYRTGLVGVNGVSCLNAHGEDTTNNSYFAITIDENFPLTRDGLYQRLKDHNIFARRYFFPLISDLPMYRCMPSSCHDNLPVASRAAQQVLCLPIHPNLSSEDQKRIISVIHDVKS